MIDESTLRELHEYYLTTSLARTAQYAQSRYGISLNRHTLSKLFRKYDLPVKLANGRDISELPTETQNFTSFELRLMAKAVELAIEDIRKYQKQRSQKHLANDGRAVEPGLYIHWASACSFLSSELYRDFLRIIIRETGRNIPIDSLVPEGITAEELAAGNMAYSLGARAMGLDV